MASTNKTSLGLNMWEASDKPVRQDFVNDNKIIDERIAKLNSDLTTGLASSAAVYNAYSSLLNSMGTWFNSSSASTRHMNIAIDYGGLDLIGFQIQLYTDVYIITAVPSLMATGSIGQTGTNYTAIISSSGILQGVSAINNGDGAVRIKLTLSTGVIGGNIKLFYPKQSVSSTSFSTV